MMFFIHYRISDGEIVEMGNGDPPTLADGLERLYSNVPADLFNQKIDVVSGAIVSKASAGRPTEINVRQAILGELMRTDSFMMPDRDDIDQSKRNQWVTYRKTLRDLSKGAPPPTAAQMLAAWPLDPDGNDNAIILRNFENPLAKRRLV